MCCDRSGGGVNFSVNPRVVLLHRGIGTYPQLGVGVGGGKSVSISVCTESIKHQKENVPNIN